MLDEPGMVELLEALAAYLREEAVPELEGATRFRALVAANVAGIVARQIELGPSTLRDEVASLSRLLELPAAGSIDPPAAVAELARRLNRELVARIERGEADADPWRARVLDHLRSTVAAKLAIDNPKALSRR